MEAEKAKAAAAEGASSKQEGEEEKPVSPQSSLEELSLQQSMDKNKECMYPSCITVTYTSVIC